VPVDLHCARTWSEPSCQSSEQRGFAGTAKEISSILMRIYRAMIAIRYVILDMCIPRS
jgi:hypothetical protein